MKHDKKAQTAQGPRFVKTGEAARILGLTPATIRSAIRRGELPGIRVGAHYLVRRDALEDLICGSETTDALIVKRN